MSPNKNTEKIQIQNVANQTTQDQFQKPSLLQKSPNRNLIHQSCTPRSLDKKPLCTIYTYRETGNFPIFILFFFRRSLGKHSCVGRNGIKQSAERAKNTFVQSG